jgi:hypothetical protein
MQTDIEKIDSLKDKIKRCAKVIKQSLINTTVGIPQDILVENFIINKLKALGIYSDSESYDLLLSEDCKEGDFRKIFCEGTDPIPLPRFRKIWSILREGSTSTTQKQQLINSDPSTYALNILKPIGQYSDEELLKKYVSNNEDSESEKELRERSKDRNFIIFKNNKEIDIELSLKMLREARRRVTTSVWNDGTMTYIVYKIGEFPNEIYDICPVTGETLLDNYSEKLGINWGKLNLDARQFIWIMHDQGIEINPLIVRTLTEVYEKDGVEGLKDLYSKIGLIYEDLKLQGNLPSLKSKNKISKKDPFGKRF